MSLHDEIMRLPAAPTELAQSLYGADAALAYKIGHRDARHAAAELAVRADTEIERLRDALATIAAQHSGEFASTKLSDCLAAFADAAIRHHSAPTGAPDDKA